MAFLPITNKEMLLAGFQEPDIVIVTGDAYVDHPSFGTAIVSRVLESAGFHVCICPQPQKAEDVTEFGRPRLAFFVNGGALDPMVNHYTVAKKRRTRDAYSPGGKIGLRPDRATKTYCEYIRSVYGDVPIAIGGLEASLRRFAHYDYWDNSVHPSILLESGADLLMYGMGENHVVEIVSRLKNGQSIRELLDVRGTCYLSDTLPNEPYLLCPSFEEVKSQNEKGFLNYARACAIQQRENDAVSGKVLVQRMGDRYLIQNKPSFPLSTEEFDRVYELPFERDYHPSYREMGGIPAIEEVKFSLVHNRGCFGGCNFCALAFHQGRSVSVRSHDSVVREAKALTALSDFKGYIHDVGGPTANFRGPSCELQKKAGMCKGKKCLAPVPCKNLKVDHRDYLNLLRKLRVLPGVKRVFIRSGIRFDYLLCDKDETFFKELVTHHVSGQLKVAPEHCADSVLSKMGKPSFSVYRKFYDRFYELTKSVGKKQYLVPYLMSSHPGSTPRDAISLASYLKKEGLHPEQVQDFYPTPGTVSTCMYYTGLDPFTLKKVFVPKTKEEKSEQRALLQYYRKENYPLVRSILKKEGREDLIGFEKTSLVPPDRRERASVCKDRDVPRTSKRKTSLTKHLKKNKRVK